MLPINGNSNFDLKVDCDSVKVLIHLEGERVELGQLMKTNPVNSLESFKAPNLSSFHLLQSDACKRSTW